MSTTLECKAKHYDYLRVDCGVLFASRAGDNKRVSNLFNVIHDKRHREFHNTSKGQVNLRFFYFAAPPF